MLVNFVSQEFETCCSQFPFSLADVDAVVDEALEKLTQVLDMFALVPAEIW